jgi:hypothetical protein
MNDTMMVKELVALAKDISGFEDPSMNVGRGYRGGKVDQALGMRDHLSLRSRNLEGRLERIRTSMGISLPSEDSIYDRTDMAVAQMKKTSRELDSIDSALSKVETALRIN